ncbi:MAG: outer membrane protein transport protein [Methylococcaceae bacterium]|nr:outer membrane protein transport protein [Methylococcaceae bacterium]
MEKYIFSVIAAALLTGAAASAFANGFALNEQSASGLGNAFAGGGAIAEDASTIFFNPAGMTYLPDNQLLMAAHAIRSSAEFNNNGSHSSGGLPTLGGGGGDAGDWAFAPNIYFAKALNNNVRLGVGINVPFAYKTDYDKEWVGRYQALKTDIKTININPSIAFKASEKVSLGLGFSAMHTDAEITNAVDFGTICATGLGGCGIGATFQKNDGFARVTGDDWSFGWNAGAIFQITNATRLSLAYRSAVHQKLEGNAYFNGIPVAFALSPALTAGFANGTVSAKLTTPDSASASVFHQINHQWDVMADLTWTHWSVFQDQTVIRTSGVLAGRTLSSVPENWDNTIRASLGANFRYTNALKLRAGFAYDQSPVSLEFRTPRTPNTDRFWLSVGANYRFTPTSSIDVGYTYIFVNDASLNKTTDTSIPSLRDTVKGSYNSNVNIISVQFTHTF